MAAHTFQRFITAKKCQNGRGFRSTNASSLVEFCSCRWRRLILAIVCVGRCSSQSELWQPAWNSQLMPQEIPAICHPYKVAFSIWTVTYRQIIWTGSDTEHPVCASHSGLNLLTCLLTHHWAVIIPPPTHFTAPPHLFFHIYHWIKHYYMCWNEQWEDVNKYIPNICTLFYN